MALDTSHFIIAAVALALGFAQGKRRAQPTGTSLAKPSDQRRLAEAKDDEDDKKMGLFERVFTIVFLSGWLIAWTTGIVAVASKVFMAGEIEPFLIGWMIAAIAGWVFAAATLVQAIRGKRLVSRRYRRF